MNTIKVARGLGWFGIGVGVSELFFGRRLARLLGLERHLGLLRLFGLRETGVGIVGSGGLRGGWLWGPLCARQLSA